jgi:Ala-tRNA(Pro) deacylase
MYPNDLYGYLNKEMVSYHPMHHPLAVEAQHLAAAVGVSGRKVAKAVFVMVADQPVVCILPANRRLDFNQLSAVLDEPDVRLMTESEFEPLFPDCERGAIPPIGALLQIPMVVDSSLAANDDIVLRAGTHEDCVQMSYADFERLSQPILVDDISILPSNIPSIRSETETDWPPLWS